MYNAVVTADALFFLFSYSTFHWNLHPRLFSVDISAIDFNTLCRMVSIRVTTFFLKISPTKFRALQDFSLTSPSTTAVTESPCSQSTGWRKHTAAMQASVHGRLPRCSVLRKRTLYTQFLLVRIVEFSFNLIVQQTNKKTYSFLKYKINCTNRTVYEGHSKSS